ncbi:3-dehydroquinate synthase [Flavicella sp.]|uniref:3-dehydroquinate synthase n=1 Tax=Flavicella sp. TaxID=2957742 RepID=UPI00262F1C67|nr:3-dehydroquinate synthase [Flavicella sp.]MDG1804933.1 3-dehydroquinate synthase [Flavicella sp.]
MNKVIQQNFQVQFNYNISFTEDVFRAENTFLKEVLTSVPSIRTAKAVVVLDQGLYAHQRQLIDKIETYFQTYHKNITLMGTPLIVDGGEKVKNNWNSVESVLELLNTQKIDRHSFIISVGGGAVLDMVGFASAIAHRGVRLIRIPTTVLSQNDSGVGVKNSFNYFEKKNFLGTFQPPFAVINDSYFLDSLSDRDFRSGISEAIKVALIKDVSFFEWIENNSTLLNNRDSKTIEHLIFRCAELHTEHIGTAGDPFEQGSSRPLDFGHWAAHKLEYLTNYKLTHGEAVAVGIVLDSSYSYFKGFLTKEEMLRIITCFQQLNFQLDHELLFDPEDKNAINPELISGLEEFREHLGGELTIMLLKSIGKGGEIHEMEEEKLNESVAFIKTFVINLHAV